MEGGAKWKKSRQGRPGRRSCGRKTRQADLDDSCVALGRRYPPTEGVMVSRGGDRVFSCSQST